MNKLLAFILLAAAPQLSAQVTIRAFLPPSTPRDATIYVAGTFNNWQPADEAFRLQPSTDDTYAVTLPASVSGPIEFKFTLGSWDRVETAEDGSDIANRRANAGGRRMLLARIDGWKQSGPAARASTARPTVSVLSEKFEIAQLGRTRRIWLYLPPDYATSNKRYPVLYAQDGQNLFDDALSFAGEWSIDEALDSLAHQGYPAAIVVGIENGGANRTQEYHAWSTALLPNMGAPQAEQYLEFLVKTLKPYVDARYRTLRDAAHTGVVGSSSGGSFAFYAALKYPQVFGRAVVFSPAFFANPEIYALARAQAPRLRNVRFYMVSGAQERVPIVEAGAFARAQQQMADTLKAAGFDVASNLRSLLPEDGAHTEWFWRREFPKAYVWLFGR